MNLNFNQMSNVKSTENTFSVTKWQHFDSGKTLIDAMASCECFNFVVHLFCLYIDLFVGGGNQMNLIKKCLPKSKQRSHKILSFLGKSSL